LTCGDSTFCKNGGTCVNIPGVTQDSLFGLRCDCPAGYSGFFCEFSNKGFKMNNSY